MKSSLKPSLSKSLQPRPRPSSSCLLSPRPSCADPTRNVYSGYSSFAFRSPYSPSQVFEFKMISFIFLKMYHLIFTYLFYFFINCGRAAALEPFWTSSPC